MSGGTASAGARPFLFGEDLRAPRAGTDASRQAAEAAAAALRDAAAADGYARGMADGRQLEAEQTARRLAEAAERLAAEIRMMVAGIDGRIAAVEDEALAFFGAAARKLAAGALDARPLTGVQAAATEAFRHLRGVPHLALRVHASLVDESERLLRDLSRLHGFEGRVIVIGDDEIAPGDARAEWADGGIARDGAALDAALAEVMKAARVSEPAAAEQDE